MELLCVQCHLISAMAVGCSLCRQSPRLCTACFILHLVDHLQRACATDNIIILSHLRHNDVYNWKELERRVPTAHFAAGNGSERILTMLAGFGVDMNRPNAQGCKGIHAASQQGEVGCIRILVANGVSPESLTTNNVQTTPAITACTSGMLVSLVFLLGLGANPNTTSSIGQSPAQVACLYGHKTLLLLLISRGADVNLSDANGQTPVIMAIIFGNKDCVGILLAHDAALPLSEKELPCILRDQKVSLAGSSE